MMQALACDRVSAGTLADVVEQLTPSVVGVGAAFPPRSPTRGRPTQRLSGSGFAVRLSDRALIVTNAHVIPEDVDSVNGEMLSVFIPRGKAAEVRPARLVASDPVHDLALLAYEGAALPGVPLATGGARRPGERVAFTGFPIGAVLGLFPATHEGIIAAITPIARPADNGRQLTAAALRRLREPFDVYQLDAIAYPGNSGSAVYLSETGEVIGVMNSVFVKDTRESLLEKPSGISYAIPVRYVLELAGSLSP